MYASCSIVWDLKLLRLIVLNTTETEHITLSLALCEVISVIITNELKDRFI